MDFRTVNGKSSPPTRCAPGFWGIFNRATSRIRSTWTVTLWYARLFMRPHVEIEYDPGVWNQVESLIRSELPPVMANSRDD